MILKNTNKAERSRNKPNPAACLISICFCLLFCIGAESGWIEVRSPNFIVISDASPKQARHAAKSFEQFRSMLLTSLPMLKVDSGSALVIFAARDGRSMKALYSGNTPEKGILKSSPEASFAVLDINAPGGAAYQEIYHQYARMVLRQSFLNPPLWLSEGLGELLGSVNISERASDIGNPSPKLLRILGTQPRLPLTALLAIKPESQYYRRQEKFEAFHAQSWAFTHYLMFGDKQSHAGQLQQLLELLQNDAPQLEAQARALGDLSVLESGYNEYLRKLVFQHSSIPVQPDLKENQYAVRTLSQADSLALRGKLLLGAGRLDDAKRILERALKQDPRSAEANEGMGLLQARLQNQEQARKYLEAAAQLDPKSALAQYHAAANMGNDSGDPKKMESYLRKALDINPKFALAFKTLYQLLMTQEERLPEALDFARKAADLEPAEISHRIITVKILIDMGKEDEAFQLGERLLAISPAETDRKWIESLLDIIKARRAASIENQQRNKSRQEDRRKANEQKRPDSEKRKKDRKERQEKAGPPGKAKGIIRSVKCGEPAIMDVKLDSNGKQYKLRAENLYAVQYWTVGVPVNSSFAPCNALEGKQVEIEYLSISGQEYSGLIQSIAIEK
jgi:tetratricopeptide (TPR) repeat protein